MGNISKGRPKSQVPFVCQNPKCAHYIKEKKNKLTIKRGKYHTTGHQRYQCKHCNIYFMETNGALLYRKHLTEQQITNICNYLVEKNGMRSIEHLTGHHRDTIGNLLGDMVEHVTEVNDYLMKNLGLSQYECDEIWVFVKKKKDALSGLARLSLEAVTAASVPP